MSSSWLQSERASAIFLYWSYCDAAGHSHFDCRGSFFALGAKAAWEKLKRLAEDSFQDASLKKVRGYREGVSVVDSLLDLLDSSLDLPAKVEALAHKLDQILTLSLSAKSYRSSFPIPPGFSDESQPRLPSMLQPQAPLATSPAQLALVAPHQDDKVDRLCQSLENQQEILAKQQEALLFLMQNQARVDARLDHFASELSARKPGNILALPEVDPRAQTITPNTTYHDKAQAKAVTTLRSGNVVDNYVGGNHMELEPSIPSVSIEQRIDPIEQDRVEPVREKGESSTQPHRVGKEPVSVDHRRDNSVSRVPYPSTLEKHSDNEDFKAKKILEHLRDLKVNLPLLDAIQSIPSYSKFFKDLCTRK